jgi:hypothetical protein
MLSLLLISSISWAQVPIHLWSQRFGDSSFQYARSVTVDNLGNVIVTGRFESGMDFGGGSLTSAGGVDIFVAKFNPSGNHIWSQRFGDSDYQGSESVAVDSSGNIILTGRFKGTVNFGGDVLTSAGSFDIFVAKFDPSGNHLWSQRFGNTEWDQSNGITVDGSGNVLLTGYFQGVVDFGGGSLTSAGGVDIFVAKFDPSGNHIWSQRFGDSSYQYAFSVAVDSTRNILVTGNFGGAMDFGGGALTSAGVHDIFVVKFNPNGNHVWSQRFGDSLQQYTYSVTVDGSANVIFTGEFSGTMDLGGGTLTCVGYCDIFVAKFDPSGNHLWSQRFGDSGWHQSGASVTSNGFGNVIVTGNFDGTVDFGAGTLTSAGDYDIYVAKFGPDGVPIQLQSFCATFKEPGIEISWHLTNGGVSMEFFVLRAEAPSGEFWELENPEISREDLFFNFVDKSCEPGLTYRYRVDVSDENGRRILFETEAIDTPVLSLTLNQNYPNPFNPSTTISFTLPRREKSNLLVYNIEGKIVTTLIDKILDEGYREATWDGTDSHGNVVSSGVYFYRMKAGDKTLTKKMVLLK